MVPDTAFEIVRALGAGATARVWLVRLAQPIAGLPTGVQVALKRLRPELASDPLALRAFRTEEQAGLSAHHPGLASTFYAGQDEQGHFQLQPYVSGLTLQALLERSGPLPEPLLRAAASQLAGGLAALHAAGWAHGDVKPENMRLDDLGRAALLDLGFAVRLHGGEEPGGVEPHSGSLSYLSPERARGRRPDTASDVFALGVALYELATGAHPFLQAEQALAAGAAVGRRSSGKLLRRSLEIPGADRLLAALATARLIPPSRLVPQLSPLLDQLLAEMLDRDPERRPDAREISQRLAQGEASAWWREHLDLGALARRGVMGEPEAAHLTPLVGRKLELERLLATWQDIATPALGGGPSHGGTAVWLAGPEGSGKSRLASDFAAAARRGASPPVYLYGRCSALELQRPCTAVLRLLQRWLRLPPDGSPGSREKAQIERLIPPDSASALLLALETELEQASATAVPVALSEWLLALARTTPLVVYLDDINFADEGTLSVLAHVAVHIQTVPMLLLIGERELEGTVLPEQLGRVRQRLLALGRAYSLRLEPLDEEAVLDLVTRLFHRSAPLHRLARVLWERSRGSPGLLAEILRHLMEGGQAHPRSASEPGLVLSISPDELPLPASLRTLIQERFEKLTALERRWLRRLSIVGGRIDVDFLLRAFPGAGAPELGRVLTRLVSIGWLVPAGARYRFARPALREAVYRSLPQAPRVRLHAAAARALGAIKGQDGAPRGLSLEDAFQRAFHLHAAGERSALLRVIDPLIAALLRRGQPGRVHALAQWGLEALDALKATPTRGRERIRLLEAAADAADRLGEREIQRQWLDRLSELDLSPERHPKELARVYLLHGRFAANTGQFGLARGMLRNAVELSARAGEGELESEAARRLADVQAHVGELEEAAQLVEVARERAGDPVQEALAWLLRARLEVLRNELEQALRSVDRALRTLRSASGWSLPGVVAAAHLMRGRIYRLAGRPRRALGALQHAVRLARQAGERRLEAEATARLGGLMLDIDRPQEAEARLREALWMADEIEDRRGRTLASLWLGVLLWEQGDPQGVRLVGVAASLAAQTGLAREEALALAIQARAALDAGRREEALELSARALELSESNGAELADHVVIHGTRALALSESGATQPAKSLVRELRRRVRQENERLQNPVTRRRHRLASTRLLEAVLNADGRIYPRVPLAAGAR